MLGQTLVPITQADYEEAARQDAYYAGRWSYYKAVADMVGNLMPLESILEIGANRLPIVRGCDTMDNRAVLPDLTYLHDASHTPWPMTAKKYDLLIALQVWEHLQGRQQEAFREVMRVSRAAILSFPFRWFCPDDANHHAIDEKKITWWTLGVKPQEIVVVTGVRKRIIYRFAF